MNESVFISITKQANSDLVEFKTDAMSSIHKLPINYEDVYMYITHIRTDMIPAETARAVRLTIDAIVDFIQSVDTFSEYMNAYIRLQNGKAFVSYSRGTLSHD